MKELSEKGEKDVTRALVGKIVTTTYNNKYYRVNEIVV